MTFLAGAAPAGAAACTPADAPPRVLGVTAEDVTFLRSGPGPEMHVTVQNACGGTSTYVCSSEPTTSCTGVKGARRPPLTSERPTTRASTTDVLEAGLDLK